MADEKKEPAKEERKFITRKTIKRREGDEHVTYPPGHPIENKNGPDELNEWRSHDAVWDSIDERDQFERASEGIVSRGPKLKITRQKVRRKATTADDRGIL